MRIAIAIVAILIALGLLGYLVVGWGTTIQTQGIEAALSEQTTQPPFLVTAVGSVFGGVLLLVGLWLLRDRDQR
jgi:hypothetical protein